MKKILGWLSGKSQEVARNVKSMKTESEAETALESYLQFYETRQNPRYAVLVTGEWGVGKTFQVQRAIPTERHYYISLFGMAKPEDVEAAVFAQMSPTRAFLNSISGKLEKTTIQGIPVGNLGSPVLRFLLRGGINNDRTIIFDDLERSTIDPRDLLGVINLYVEHHRCRVVVIAHDDKLSKELQDQKEKLFGQTIKALPQVELAYIEFSKDLGSSDENNFLLSVRPMLTTIFDDSRVFSLRILRHVMEDTLRLIRCLTSEQRNHPDAIKELISFFAAMNFECRANRLQAGDLADRMKKEIAYKMSKGRDGNSNVEKPPIVATMERYTTVRFDSSILPDDLLCEMLFEGLFRKTRILEAINASTYFAKPAEIPAWRAFVEFQEQSDYVADESMRRFNEDFENRNVIEPGEMLHMFALRMMQAQNGLINDSVSEAANNCKNYIDDLKKAGKLRPTPTALADREDLRNGYQGLGYWVEDAYKREWGEIFKYLHDQRHSAMLESLREAAPEILNLIEQDGQKLYSVLNHTASNIEKFAGVPVLEFIDPGKFVGAWLRSHPRNWYWIQQAIMDRFKHDENGRIERELPFLKEIIQLLQAESKRVGGIRGLQIMRRIPRVPREPEQT